MRGQGVFEEGGGRVKIEIVYRGEGGTNKSRRGAKFDIFC